MSAKPTNYSRLVALFAAKRAVPPGANMAYVVSYIASGAMGDNLRVSIEEAKAAIRLVRKAPQPNPWAEATDEDIAGKIIAEVEKRKN